MSFRSINEVDKFQYRDCRILKRENTGTDLVLRVEALIVKRDNSQNSNFTESYADESLICFKNGRLVRGIREGMKKYDANERLLEEIPDVVLEEAELQRLGNSLDGMYLQGIEGVDGMEDYVLFLEKEGEDPYAAQENDTYQLRVSCDAVEVSWERYLNRVQ